MSRWMVVECHDGGLIPCVVLRSEGGHAVLPVGGYVVADAIMRLR